MRRWPNHGSRSSCPMRRRDSICRPLEAMRYCDLTLVPDCVGNRGFCLPDVNCLMPTFSAENISETCDRAYRMLGSQEQLASLRRAANDTLARHSLERERKEFLRIMDSLDQLW